MGIKARKRQIVCDELGYAIREPSGAYSTVFDAEIGGLNYQNTIFLDENDLNSVIAVVRPRNSLTDPRSFWKRGIWSSR
jgi:hypothetical protein